MIFFDNTRFGKIQNTYIHFDFNKPAFFAKSVSLWSRITLLNTSTLFKKANIRKSSKVHSHSACQIFLPFYAESIFLI